MLYTYQFMQERQDQSTSIQNLGHISIEETSPQDLTKDQLSENDSIRGLNKSSSNRCRRTFITFLALTILAVLLSEVSSIKSIISKSNGGGLGQQNNSTFFVYCPYSSLNNNRKTVNDQLRRLYQSTHAKYQDPDYSINVQFSNAKASEINYLLENLYVVQIKHETVINQTVLKYCGLTRGFYEENCQKAVYRCTSPGPMFDLNASQWTDILWVNLLSNQNIIFSPDFTGGSCFNDTKDPRCQINPKLNSKQTYQDPTINHKTQLQSSVKITSNNWPASTHVHGAQIRPTFDGNPLSWIDNTGLRGQGAMSLDDKCYYDQFTKFGSDKNTSYLPSRVVVTYKNTKSPCNTYKINRYPNQQNPGNLWYHDHAMRLTTFNVRNGLSGLYILRQTSSSQKIIDLIKERTNEILIMMTTDGWKAQEDNKFNKDTIYRFRFLNNNFARDMVFNITFQYGKCQENNVLEKYANFMIIAADSSLFSQPIYNQTYFIISQAQRMGLLVQFDRLNAATCNNQNKQSCISICSFKVNDTQPVLSINVPSNIQTNTNQQGLNTQRRGKSSKHHYKKQKKQHSPLILTAQMQESNQQASVVQSKKINLKNLTFNIPYTNFSQVNVTVKRMRPLIVYQDTFIFTINGRADFHSGKSQNPVVGTYQDWYIINTIFEGHPIHIHLINFQVVQIYDLVVIKTFRKRDDYKGDYTNIICTLYQLDFYVETFRKNYEKERNNKEFMEIYNQIFITYRGQEVIDYDFLCFNLTQICSLKNFKEQMVNKVNVEDQFVEVDANVENKSKFNVSGIYLFAKRSLIQERSIKYAKYINNATFTPQADQTLQYVPTSKGRQSPKPYYQRWKDTAFVQAYQAAVFRIRWTKSDFNESNPNDTFFHVPADQLRQFPGFVYHCHILDHEDNQMMRPIMLQLPSDANQNPSRYLDTSLTCNKNANASLSWNTSWKTKYQCLNQQCNVTTPDKSHHN